MDSKHKSAYGSLLFHVSRLEEHNRHVDIMNEDDYENGSGAIEIDAGFAKFQIAMKHNEGIHYAVSMTHMKTGQSEAVESTPANMGHAVVELSKRFEIIA